MSDRALLELEDQAAQGDTVLGALLQRYDLGEGHLVDNWLRLARPQRAAQGRRSWPDAPAGLRGRDVVAGLADASRRWRRGERPPRPAEQDDSDRQLELPEPVPPLRISAVEELEPAEPSPPPAEEVEPVVQVHSDASTLGGVHPLKAAIRARVERGLPLSGPLGRAPCR